MNFPILPFLTRRNISSTSGVGLKQRTGGFLREPNALGFGWSSIETNSSFNFSLICWSVRPRLFQISINFFETILFNFPIFLPHFEPTHFFLISHYIFIIITIPFVLKQQIYRRKTLYMFEKCKLMRFNQTSDLQTLLILLHNKDIYLIQ